MRLSCAFIPCEKSRIFLLRGRRKRSTYSLTSEGSQPSYSRDVKRSSSRAVMYPYRL